MSLKERAIEAGRNTLCRWLEAAKDHGTIYYTVRVNKAGDRRWFSLWTIAPERNTGKTAMWKLWPSADSEEQFERADYSKVLEYIAKDWGFSFQKRTFVISGGGMDMAFALIDDLASKAGLDGSKFANYVHREELV